LNIQSNLFKGNNNLLLGTIIFAIVFVTFLLILPTGIDNNEEAITKVYYADNISFAHELLIDRFNEKNKGEIKVIPVNLPFTKFSTNERKELLARMLRSKSDRIDIFTVDLIWVPRFAKWCQPLDQYISYEFRDQIINPALVSCYYDTHLVAIPLYIDIAMMYYRRDILQQLPEAADIEKRLKDSVTWEEFITLKQRFQRHQINNPFYIFPANNYEGLICGFYESLAGQTQSFFSGDSVQLNTPQARKSLQLLVDLVNKDNITPRAVVKFDEVQGYLYALKNDAIFMRGWPGFPKQYRFLIEDTSKFQYFSKAALPHFKDGKPVFVLGGWNFMISKFSKKTDAANQFIKFCLQKENQQLLFENGDYIPINKSVYTDSLFLLKHPHLLYYYELLKKGVHRPYHKDYTKISDVISYYVHLAIKKEISVGDALDRATKLINSNQVLIK